jgi:hypothetical protein
MGIEAGRRSADLKLIVVNDPEADDRADRLAPRYRTFLAGRIRNEDGSEALCVIRDMSKSGARLVVDPQGPVSPTIELHVMSRDEVFRGRVVWRKDDIVGMRFSGWTKRDGHLA